LRINTEGKDIQSSGDTAPILLQNAPTGDFEISTYIQMMPTADYQQGGIIMYGDDANYIRLTYLFFGTGPVFEFGPEVNGGFTSMKGPLPAGPRAPGYFLQLDKKGTTYMGYGSGDGIHWSVVGTMVDSTLTPVRIGLLAFNAVGTGAASIPADYDFFQERALPHGVSRPLPVLGQRSTPTASTASGTVKVTLPGPNTILIGSFLPFVWKPYPKATYYDLQIWLVQAIPAHAIATSAVTTFTARLRGNSYKLSVTAMPKGIYHWRMAATDTSGALMSAWTPEQAVTLQ
jgi:hypothetical protein